MRQVPPPRRSRRDRAGRDSLQRNRSDFLSGPPALQGPTFGGVMTAATTVALLTAVSLLLLIPAVFFVMPMPREADAITLCLPGVGPIQRFRDGLRGEHEELVFIHENVHAAQCRMFGPAWYAKQAASPVGRLALEAPALCEEVAVLSKRGEDHARLRDRAVEVLASGYLDRTGVPRRDISAAVDRACGASMGD